MPVELHRWAYLAATQLHVHWARSKDIDVHLCSQGQTQDPHANPQVTGTWAQILKCACDFMHLRWSLYTSWYGDTSVGKHNTLCPDMGKHTYIQRYGRQPWPPPPQGGVHHSSWPLQWHRFTPSLQSQPCLCQVVWPQEQSWSFPGCPQQPVPFTLSHSSH